MNDPKHTMKVRRDFTISVEMWAQSAMDVDDCMRDIKREAIRVSHRKVLDKRYRVEIVSATLV